MPLRADLHIHTTASDGMFSPEAIVDLAYKTGLDIIAITDHDTMDGVAPARDAAKKYALNVISGVELSTELDGQEIHVLGYFGNSVPSAMAQFFCDMQSERIARANEMIRRLSFQGYFLDRDEIFAQAEGSVGRPHIARAMVKHGYAASVQDAFSRFLLKGCPGYVPRKKLLPSAAVRLLREAGAVPVLAHPGQIHWPTEKLLPLLHTWIDCGLQGLEAFHPSHGENCDKWLRIACAHDLLVTGGSDFHTASPETALLGSMTDLWNLSRDADQDIAHLQACCRAPAKSSI